ncbi:MAG: hypothetical protein ACHQVS_04465 [Candidatus Babeliales bacterium]
MKKLLVTSLLISSFAHAVTLDIQLTITGHEAIHKQITLDNPTTPWQVATNDCIIEGAITEYNEESAICACKIYEQQTDGSLKLICSPTLKMQWNKIAQLRLGQGKSPEAEESALSLDITASK